MSTNIYKIINMDRYYCLIRLTSSSKIALYLFSYQYIQAYPLCFVSSSSNMIYQLIDVYDMFMDLSLTHILYLGRELYKAEVSLELGQKYIQN